MHSLEVLCLQRSVGVELIDVGKQDSSVKVIGHMTSIVNTSNLRRGRERGKGGRGMRWREVESGERHAEQQQQTVSLDAAQEVDQIGSEQHRKWVE